MPASRLRPSFSTAFSRHRDWNTHSPQCGFRTSSGREGPASSAKIFSTRLRTSPANAPVFQFHHGVIIAMNDFAEIGLACHRSREHECIERQQQFVIRSELVIEHEANWNELR